MSLSISKSEKDAVLAELLLGGEGDTPEECAKDLANRVIHAFLDVREKRAQRYVASDPGHMWALWGPYPTTAGAHKAIAKVPVSHEGQKFLILPVHQEVSE
jgi:hypothetical protein